MKTSKKKTDDKFLKINSDHLKEIVGKKLKKLRIDKQYTQEFVAEQIGISTDLIRGIENGRNLGSIPTVLKLCSLFEITPDELFYEVIDVHHSNTDALLYSYFNKIDPKDKDILKKIIVYLDKNY